MENRTLRLLVDGWSNPRFGRVEGNLVMFEVMRLSCACDTCLDRLDLVYDRMAKSDAEWTVQTISIPERGGTSSRVLVVGLKEMPEKVDAFLSELLGLQISEIAEVSKPAVATLV